MIQLLVIDDRPVVSRGLTLLLKEDPEKRFSVIEEAGNIIEVIEKLKAFNFNAILLNICIPGRNGLEMIQEIKRIKSNLPVLILGIYAEDQYALKALNYGASGYLNKACSPEEIIKAIIKVSEGGRYISASLIEKLTTDILYNYDKPVYKKLTAREIEVMLGITSGKKINEIAAELSLSPKTISTYRQRILSKLNLRTTSEIIRYAIKEGLAD